MPATQLKLQAEITYEQFCETWIEDTKCALRETQSTALDNGSAEVGDLVEHESSQSTQHELRREFLTRLFSDYIQSDVGAEWFYVGDGERSGVDAFAFHIIESSNSEEESEIVAYVVRFLDKATISHNPSAPLHESAKLRATFESSETPGDLAPLLDFARQNRAELKLTLLFASVNPMGAEGQKAAEQSEAVLRGAFPQLHLRVEPLSLHTIYRRDHTDYSVQVPLKLQSAPIEKGAAFAIGAVSLSDLWFFLHQYEQERGDLDPLYEKNVRLFLGRTGKINKGVSKTLREEPENFGLFNNGITLVAREISPGKNGEIVLTDPSIVNGCQTTRTLYATLGELFKERADAEAAAKWKSWHERLRRGVVVVKVVRVAPAELDSASNDEELLFKITKFTNSQNAVKDKDFVALDQDFRRWKRELATQGVFLEILRNEGTAQKARQNKRDYKGPRYAHIAKAFELFKVFGAGWINEPGSAWNKNAAFVPGGALFKQIVRDEKFGGADFRAALLLQNASEARGFGKRLKSVPESRRLSRFLFYRIAIELLRRHLKRLDLPAEQHDCTQAIRALETQGDAARMLFDYATETVDRYFDQNEDYSIFHEPNFAGNFNDFLKKESLAKTPAEYPQFFGALNLTASLMSRDAAFTSRADPALRDNLKP